MARSGKYTPAAHAARHDRLTIRTIMDYRSYSIACTTFVPWPRRLGFLSHTIPHDEDQTDWSGRLYASLFTDPAIMPAINADVQLLMYCC